MVDYKIKSIEIWDPTDFRTLNHLFKWSINLWVLFLIFPLINDLPITIPETLFLKASLGVITLDWSFALSPGNLIPGATINKFLYFFLTIFASWAEQTIPSQPDFLINPACFNTNCSTDFVCPISLSDFLLRLVRIVTPSTFKSLLIDLAFFFYGL